MRIPIRKRPGSRRAPATAEAVLAAAAIAAAAAAYAAAELAATILIGGFFSWGRAEALLFFALRPWLLLAAAVLAQRFGWQARFGFYGSALLLAAISESVFLIALGASNPWPEASRGILGGAALLLLFDLVLKLGQRLGGPRAGRSAAIGLLVLLLVVPNGLRPYEVIVAAAPTAKPTSRQDLMLMSALPLIWGEKGPLDPASRPAAAYRALAEEFRIRPLDTLDGARLGTGRLLLLAQPRALAPQELVALDEWVRSGGRVLVLTDPQLIWPSELPLGDLRRAPAIGLLDPLLSHWGLRLDPPVEPRTAAAQLHLGAGPQRLVMFAPGSFIRTGQGCAVGPIAQLARCRLGRGEAILLGDADMMHDALWVGPGNGGDLRHRRQSDNPLILADWLDELAGVTRARSAGSVEWLGADADRGLALIFALLPILAAAAPAASLRLRRRG